MAGILEEKLLRFAYAEAQNPRSSVCSSSAVHHDAHARLQSGEVHVWEVQEITFAAARDYANPYVEVDCWVELEGPGFRRRVYGFWDGGRTFKVRFVATAPGEWSWRAASNRPDDAGLQGAGKFRAVAWTAAEIEAEPESPRFRACHRQRPCAALRGWHAEFFLIGDTWLAASTWRLPWRGVPAAR